MQRFRQAVHTRVVHARTQCVEKERPQDGPSCGSELDLQGSVLSRSARVLIGLSARLSARSPVEVLLQEGRPNRASTRQFRPGSTLVRCGSTAVQPFATS